MTNCYVLTLQSPSHRPEQTCNSQDRACKTLNLVLWTVSKRKAAHVQPQPPRLVTKLAMLQHRSHLRWRATMQATRRAACLSSLRTGPRTSTGGRKASARL